MPKRLLLHRWQVSGSPPVLRQRLVLRIVASCTVNGIVPALRHHTSCHVLGDGGTTWIDVAQCHFTTSSLRELYNLSALTAVTSAYTANDGTLTASTSKDGLLGSKVRVKYPTTGNRQTTGLSLPSQ